MHDTHQSNKATSPTISEKLDQYARVRGLLTDDDRAFMAEASQRMATLEARSREKSLRDEIAMAALTGLLTGNAFQRADRRHAAMAQQAYAFADAMIAEGAKQ